MAGIITFDTELRDGAARLALQDMLDQMDNKRPFYASVGERLLSSTKDRFRQQNAPDGTPWAPLSPRTIKARESAGLTPISILRARGYLAGSINYIATSDEVSVGSGVAYAAIHQLGGIINKPARQAKIYRMKDDNGQVGRRFVKKGDANHVTDVTIPTHKINIPARPYLGLTAADEEGILEDAQDWLMG